MNLLGFGAVRTPGTPFPRLLRIVMEQDLPISSSIESAFFLVSCRNFSRTYVPCYFRATLSQLVLLNFADILMVTRPRLISGSNEISILCLLASLNFIFAFPLHFFAIE